MGNIAAEELMNYIAVKEISVIKTNQTGKLALYTPAEDFESHS